MEQIVPEFHAEIDRNSTDEHSPIYMSANWNSLLSVLESMHIAELEFRLAALMLGVAPIKNVNNAYSSNEARVIMHRLHLSAKTINEVCSILDASACLPGNEDYSIKKALSEFGYDTLCKAIIFRKASIAAQHADNQLNRHSTEAENLSQILKHIEMLKAQDACISVAQLAVDGNDIIDLGVAPGPQVGRILKALLDKVMRNKCNNTRNELLDIAEDLI